MRTAATHLLVPCFISYMIGSLETGMHAPTASRLLQEKWWSCWILYLKSANHYQLFILGLHFLHHRILKSQQKCKLQIHHVFSAFFSSASWLCWPTITSLWCQRMIFDFSHWGTCRISQCRLAERLFNLYPTAVGFHLLLFIPSLVFLRLCFVRFKNEAWILFKQDRINKP